MRKYPEINKKEVLQEKMFGEIKNNELFRLAQEFGLNYLDSIDQRRVFPDKQTLKGLNYFDVDFPETTSDAIAVLRDLQGFGEPGTTAQIGGRYFGFVNGSVLPASLAARLMTDFWDQNGAMQATSPIASKLEEVVEKWLKALLVLPEETIAGFVSGTSAATFCGLAAARYRLLKNKGWDVNQNGLNGAPKIRIVAGEHIHSTALKAINLLGLGQDCIEWVPVDDQGRIIPAQVPGLDDTCLVILQAGNVNSGAFDDFKTIGEEASRVGAWVHIDGAFGLWARAVKDLKYLTEGIEWGNSWSVDGHKTLNTPYDNGIVMCRDKEALVSALHTSGAYLVLSESRDGMFYTPEMSRRARIFELWAAMKYLGKRGIDELVFGFHHRAKQISGALESLGFTILNDVVFNQVLVYYQSDEQTVQILKHVQDSGVCWCGGTTWQGKKAIRVSICSWATTEVDIRITADAFMSARDGSMA